MQVCGESLGTARVVTRVGFDKSSSICLPDWLKVVEQPILIDTSSVTAMMEWNLEMLIDFLLNEEQINHSVEYVSNEKLTKKMECKSQMDYMLHMEKKKKYPIPVSCLQTACKMIPNNIIFSKERKSDHFSRVVSSTVMCNGGVIYTDPSSYVQYYTFIYCVYCARTPMVSLIIVADHQIQLWMCYAKVLMLNGHEIAFAYTYDDYLKIKYNPSLRIVLMSMQCLRSVKEDIHYSRVIVENITCSNSLRHVNANHWWFILSNDGVHDYNFVFDKIQFSAEVTLNPINSHTKQINTSVEIKTNIKRIHSSIFPTFIETMFWKEICQNNRLLCTTCEYFEPTQTMELQIGLALKCHPYVEKVDTSLVTVSLQSLQLALNAIKILPTVWPVVNVTNLPLDKQLPLHVNDKENVIEVTLTNDDLPSQSNRKKDVVETLKNQEDCSVCYDAPVQVVTTCLHTFCLKCIQRCILQYKKCPVCCKQLTNFGCFHINAKSDDYMARNEMSTKFFHMYNRINNHLKHESDRMVVIASSVVYCQYEFCSTTTTECQLLDCYIKTGYFKKIIFIDPKDIVCIYPTCVPQVNKILSTVPLSSKQISMLHSICNTKVGNLHLDFILLNGIDNEQKDCCTA